MTAPNTKTSSMTTVTDLKPNSFDRTSGWVRYVRTAQALTRLKGAFHLDWEVQRQDRLQQPEDPEQVKAAIQLCRKFLQGVL